MNICARLTIIIQAPSKKAGKKPAATTKKGAGSANASSNKIVKV